VVTAHPVEAAAAQHGEKMREAARLAALHIGALDGDQAAAQERAAAAERVAAELAALSEQAACIVCFDDSPAHEGVFCSGERPHFLCRECFDGHVAAQSDVDVGEASQRGGRVHCACRPEHAGGCAAEPFADVVIAQHVSAETFAAYLGAKQAVLEARLTLEINRDWEQRLQVMQERAADQRRARRKFIVDKILTSTCPRCGQAWVDFTGCCALTCSHCHCGFCAFCLADCGGNAHAHVAHCAWGGQGVHMRIQDWAAARNRHRVHLLRQYLAKLDPTAKAHALEDCRQDLDDLKINVAELR